MQNRKQDAPGEVAARITRVIEQHTLSAVAARTGTPLANVHRYSRGAKVPADFCARLVREFKVNPAWLLNGEGAISTADVADGTRRMAGDLLELVEAMNAVTQMRLGALTGKHHLKVLRELDDALRRYDNLRQRLDAHAMPIFRKLATDAQTALNRLDVERAGQLLRAIEQVVRLCRDTSAEDIQLGLRSHYAVLTRDRELALRLQQQMFRAPMAQGRIDTEAMCEQATRLVITLSDAGREGDALRLGEAAMLLAHPDIRGSAAFAMLNMMTANLMVHTGRLHDGLAGLQRSIPRVPDASRRRAGRHMLTMALVYGGLMLPSQAIDSGDDYDVKAFDLLCVAMYVAEPGLLRKALDYRQSGRIERADVYRPWDFFTDCAGALLHALSAQRKQADSAWRAIERKWLGAGHDAEIMVWRVQSDLALGRDAAKAHAQASRLVQQAATRKLGLAHRATHWRNSLVFAGSAEARAALQHYLDAGYELFRHGLPPDLSGAGRG
ncbi:MAG: hypothetical protein KF696_12080 [Planctomycetes bacterium]|nr:hypothetical protein [Planctomycetota bacterium]MCW8136539.1 hypothetical protein [Planctomycetota bacterium]